MFRTVRVLGIKGTWMICYYVFYPLSIPLCHTFIYAQIEVRRIIYHLFLVINHNNVDCLNLENTFFSQHNIGARLYHKTGYNAVCNGT